MKTPRPVSDFENFLPHRAPFIWVDEILEVTPEGGECRVKLASTGLYMDEHCLRQSSLIEFMAQSFGYLRAAQLRAIDLSAGPNPGISAPARAYLVGVQDALFSLTRPILAGESLTIKVSGIRQFGALTSFRGSVFASSGETLISANLKIFSD